MRRLNKEQRKLTSEFLANLAVALITLGAISPLFVRIEDVVKLGLQVLGSLGGGLLLFLVATGILKSKRKR